MSKKNAPDIFESAYKGDFNYVSSKLEEDPSLLTKKDDCERMILHWAVLSGNGKLVPYLLELGSPVDPLDDTDTSPLILASSAGFYVLVCILLDKGAAVNQKTSSGHSSLQYAASKDHREICDKLLQYKADINIADNQKATPLHRAASKGNLAIVKLLLNYRDQLNIDPKDSYGNTPLHLACEEDRQEEALLLVQNGASLSNTNVEGKTPLDLCSRALHKLLSNK